MRGIAWRTKQDVGVGGRHAAAGNGERRGFSVEMEKFEVKRERRNLGRETYFHCAGFVRRCLVSGSYVPGAVLLAGARQECVARGA